MSLSYHIMSELSKEYPICDLLLLNGRMHTFLSRLLYFLENVIKNSTNINSELAKGINNNSLFKK